MAKNDPLSLLHDANRRNQDAVLELRAVHGWWGYGLNQALREMLREAHQADFRLKHSRIGAYAGSLGVKLDELQTLIDECIRIGLFDSDGEHFWCPDVLEKMDRYGARVQKLSEGGRKGVQARLAKFQARLKPPLPEGDAGHPKNVSLANENSSLLNITELNGTEDLEVGSRYLEVPQPEDTTPPHPFAKYFNQAAQCLSSGRRPLLQYPHVWLHPWELQDARERWTEAGMDLDEWRAGLRDTNIAMEQKQLERGYKGGKALQYLTTHILTNALEQKRKKLDVKMRTGERPAARRAPSSGQPSVLGEVIGAMGIVKAVKP